MNYFHKLILDYKYLKVIKLFAIFILYLTIAISQLKTIYAQEDIMANANNLFDQGKYIESVTIASKDSSIEAQIFCARTLAIYGHFLLKGEEAMNVFMEARKYAERAVEIDNNNDNAHVEAAHTMGRYSQFIGVVSALKEGYAEKISFHLDLAIKINSKNVSAQISKGSWHAEIVNKAGFMAKILYGATANQARDHYNNALNIDGDRIGVLFEVAYGLVLLDKKQDIFKAKGLLFKALETSPENHLDQLYLYKARELIKTL
jgi:tetratricopeptide (TPR) repeat protein